MSRLDLSLSDKYINWISLKKIDIKGILAQGLLKLRLENSIIVRICVIIVSLEGRFRMVSNFHENCDPVLSVSNRARKSSPRPTPTRDPVSGSCRIPPLFEKQASPRTEVIYYLLRCTLRTEVLSNTYMLRWVFSKLWHCFPLDLLLCSCECLNPYDAMLAVS